MDMSCLTAILPVSSLAGLLEAAVEIDQCFYTRLIELLQLRLHLFWNRSSTGNEFKENFFQIDHMLSRLDAGIVTGVACTVSVTFFATLLMNLPAFLCQLQVIFLFGADKLLLGKISGHLLDIARAHIFDHLAHVGFRSLLGSSPVMRLRARPLLALERRQAADKVIHRITADDRHIRFSAGASLAMAVGATFHQLLGRADCPRS